MLCVYAITIRHAVFYSGKQKYYYLYGVTIFVAFALTAFVGSFVPSLELENPIILFFVGIIIETFFFTAGLAYKVKLLPEEKNMAENEIIKQQHEKELGKLNILIEGEERERKRIAEELHDEINGDLSAIKFQLYALTQDSEKSENRETLQNVKEMIDRSCQHLRELSHNLSPASIENYGLVQTVERYCQRMETTHQLKINFQDFGNYISLGKSNEVHVYRIIQELFMNIIKHSHASEARVQINTYPDKMVISVEDNGDGFTDSNIADGIGLSNITSRIKYLNAWLERETGPSGTSYLMVVEYDKIPES